MSYLIKCSDATRFDQMLRNAQTRGTVQQNTVRVSQETRYDPAYCRFIVTSYLQGAPGDLPLLVEWREECLATAAEQKETEQQRIEKYLGMGFWVENCVVTER